MEPTITGAESVRWNLDCLYSGLDDPKLDRDIDAWIAAAKTFAYNFRGQVGEKLVDSLRAYEALRILGTAPMEFLFLRHAQNTSDAAVTAKLADAERRMTAAEADHLTFFEHEIVALDEATIDAALTDSFGKSRRPWIDRVRQYKPYILDEKVESALTARSQFGAGSWAQFFDEVEADLRFEWKGEKKPLTELLHVMSHDPDSDVRAAALKEVNAGLGGAFGKYSAETLYVTAGSLDVERRTRGYAHPMSARNLSNRLPDEVVDALHEAVRAHGAPLARRFYTLKARHLGLKTLRWSDRNAPMPFVTRHATSWEEAKKTVLAAYRSFSPTLASLIEGMIADGRIDAPSAPNKRGGAFNSSIILQNGKPASFTLLNFLGSPRDVMTVAHELGHAVHGMLAGEAQGVLLQNAPIALCETASVFGEMTTFTAVRNSLADGGDKKAALALVMEKLDDVMNTVVRQISFSEFERRLHGWNPKTSSWESPKKFSSTQLDALWLDVTREFYGESGDVFTYENAEHLWSYVSHFHSPFYVYGYAFGELLTQSLYAAKSTIGADFESKYLDMLRAGGSKDCKALLAPFGLDATDPTFWNAGIDAGIATLVNEAEKLSNEIA